jgi:sugar (pentulose or hexulose) kinase
MIGFGDVHTRAHVYRSILEGLAYGLRCGLEQIERKTNVPIRRVKVSGGGARSDQAMQITADVIGLAAERDRVRESSGLGAAINAACGLGLHSDYQSAVIAMTHTETIFEPNLENRRLYNRLYREIYGKMYKRLKPLYRKIRDISGYPGRD